jgi:PKD repeat protein
MNIPEIYLVEPYNAYTNKQGGRKKHWHEVIEEQALMQRIMEEQMALQEANSRTLPPNSPPISQATVGNSTGVAGGAGGSPVYPFFHPELDTVNFDRSPSSGDGPLTVTFTNLTTTPELDSFLWDFGDGTSSTDENPVHVYQSGSSATNVYTASLQVTNSVTGVPGGRSPNVYVSASKPTVTAAFTYVTASGPAPTIVTFTNTTVNTSQTPTTTYRLEFGDNTYSTDPNTSNQYPTGSFTASLQATGSYGITSRYTQSFYFPVPAVVANFTFATSSGPGPVTATFTDSTTYNGDGTKAYLWTFGDGASSSNAYVSGLLNPFQHAYSNTGSFTASLQVTESSYNVSSSVVTKFYVPAPTLTAVITVSTSSNTAPSVATFTNVPAYNGSGTLTYLWTLGSGSLTSTSIIPNPTTYTVAGPYTASMQVTESSYNIATRVTQSWRLV